MVVRDRRHGASRRQGIRSGCRDRTRLPGDDLPGHSAAQIDFESVLELLRREAAAVVAYREKHGAFKSVDDLQKVPGLDFKKIASKRDRIVAF